LWLVNSGQKPFKIKLLLFEGTNNYIAVAALQFFTSQANKFDVVVALLCGQTHRSQTTHRIFNKII